MTGHTFKVGDLVQMEPNHEGVVVALYNDHAWVFWGEAPYPETVWCGDLATRPLFEPVERWMALNNLSGMQQLGATAYERLPEATVTSGRWVKVVISPAEDQS